MTLALDLVVQGGEVAFEDRTARLDVGVRDGRVAALAEPSVGLVADEIIDATGCFVLPGGIDTHTHIRWPFGGRESRDDFQSASGAAAVGGTTTVIDFVPVPRGRSALAAAEDRLAMAEGASLIDYSFHPILTSADTAVLAEIGSLIRSGFASFKVYTTYEESRLDDGAVWAVMEEISRHGGLAGFHAENDDIIRRATASLVAAGRSTIADFPLSRPSLAECEAISMVSLFARRLGAPVWIFHVSGSDAMTTIEAMRSTGTAIKAETCMHYLAFDDRVFTGPDPWRFVITPPIRDAVSQQRMWAAVKSGSLSAVASDHCAYARDDKVDGFEDFTLLPAGAPGIDARMPMLWSRGVSDRRLTVPEFVAISSGRPARALGLWPSKGRVAVGSDADLVVLDPSEDWRYPPPSEVGLTDYGLYSGLPVRGRPRRTLVRGETVAMNGRATGRPGHGRFVPRTIHESDWAGWQSSDP